MTENGWEDGLRVERLQVVEVKVVWVEERKVCCWGRGGRRKISRTHQNNANALGYPNRETTRLVGEAGTVRTGVLEGVKVR